jgi:hypothetical protein
MKPGRLAWPIPPPFVLTIPLSATSWIRKPSIPGLRVFGPRSAATGRCKLTKGSRRPCEL